MADATATVAASKPGRKAPSCRGVSLLTWSEVEHSQFEEGVIKHGWGKWQTIEQRNIIPSRNRTQIKSHAQKFLKHHAGKVANLKIAHENYAASLRGDADGWTKAERTQFEVGVIVHGWGSWSDISKMMPTRDRGQIKIYAQKFRMVNDAEFARLLEKHEKHHATKKGGDGCGDVKSTKKKATSKTPHRRASTGGKAIKTRPASASSRSRRHSAPDSIIVLSPGSGMNTRGRSSKAAAVAATKAKEFVAITIKQTPKKKTGKKHPSKKLPVDLDIAAAAAAAAASEPPKLPLLDIDDVANVTAGVGSVSLGIKMAPTFSAKKFFAANVVSPTSSYEDTAVMSTPRSYRPFTLKQDHVAQDVDDLALLAAAVTPSPAARALKQDHVAQGVDDLALLAAAVTPSPAAKGTYHHDVFKASSSSEELDSLMKFDDDDDALMKFDDLEVDTDNLDMIADFMDPSSWNTLDDRNLITPVTTASTQDDAHDDNHLMHGIEESTQAFKLPPHVYPDQKSYLDISTMLKSPPDFNNPNEYISTKDGLSRTGLDKGPLCRARIKYLLTGHMNSCWWREDDPSMSSLPPSIAAGPCTLGHGVQVDGNGDRTPPKKFAFEHLVALTAAMLTVDHWYTESNVRAASSGTSKSTFDFNDEDDIRHIGQLLSGLWERVHRSLRHNDYLSLSSERTTAINEMVDTLDTISRQVDMKSPHGPLYGHD